MNDFERARTLLARFKGEEYVYGTGILNKVGGVVASAGKEAVLVRGTFPGSDPFIEVLKESVRRNGVTIIQEVAGAGRNCPQEDLFRITNTLRETNPELVISFGGGSTIDAAKAAEVLRTLGGNIEHYFGTGVVAETIQKAGKGLSPHVAIQTAASSGAHLTKYSNITDVSAGQKKLIVDEAIVPTHPVFDWAVTCSAPPALTADGALDGIAHCVEVLYGSVGKSVYGTVEEIAETAIRLVVNHLPRVMENLQDREAREALCLATDLGSYSIMLGGTNGGHLTSFSLVDILSHGRSCAIMNPYYTVFFAPVIEDALHVVGEIYRQAGFAQADISRLTGRKLGEAVAEAMFSLARKIGFPTRLNEVPGFSDAHIKRALSAAKNPQLKMKLRNMPVALTTEMIDEYMGPILEAARDGDLSRIKNVTCSR